MSGGPGTVHILSEFLWPDAAPTGIYCELLAERLIEEGFRVRLVGGSGQYRQGIRPAPSVAIERVPHYIGSRHNLFSTAVAYRAVAKAFEAYIGEAVQRGDVVVTTSAPPTTVALHRAIHRRGAAAIYWLQDYYPELLRGIWNAPRPLRDRFRRYWNRHLDRWDRVVKVATNLDYDGPPVTVIRNWPTIPVGRPQPAQPRTAVYIGNLGFAHHVPSLVNGFEALVADGYSVSVRADGHAVQRLPPWIRRLPMCRSVEELVRCHWEAEVHVIAGHPELPGAVFPSKYWNARAVGRRVVATGFTGPMLEELHLADAAAPAVPLEQWIGLLSGFAERAHRPRVRVDASGVR